MIVIPPALSIVEGTGATASSLPWASKGAVAERDLCAPCASPGRRDHGTITLGPVHPSRRSVSSTYLRPFAAKKKREPVFRLPRWIPLWF